MRKPILSWKLATLSVLLTASSLTAGVVFEVETTDHSGSGARTESSQMSVEKPNIKIEILPGGEPDEAKDEIVFRGDRRQMVVVDHGDKSYMVIDNQAVQQIGGQIEQAQKELEKHLAQLDPKTARDGGEGAQGRPGFHGWQHPAQASVE